MKEQRSLLEGDRDRVGELTEIDRLEQEASRARTQRVGLGRENTRASRHRKNWRGDTELSEAAHKGEAKIKAHQPPALRRGHHNVQEDEVEFVPAHDGERLTRTCRRRDLVGVSVLDGAEELLQDIEHGS